MQDIYAETLFHTADKITSQIKFLKNKYKIKQAVGNMKKTMILTAAVLMALVCGARAFAAGTTSNWDVKLTFSTGSKTDVYPIIIGEGQAANELLKPPPLPGFAVTGNVDDAVVNAYVVSASAARQAAKSIGVPVSNEPGRVWPVEVQVEQASSTVSLNVDFTDFPSTGFTLSVINPETGAIKNFDQNNKSQALFTAATAGTKTLYVMAGRSSSFLVSSGSSTFGEVRASSIGMLSGIQVSDNGSVVGTTDASGAFSIPALSAGTHTIRVDKQYFIGSQSTVTVAAAGGSVVLDDIYAGDLNDDGVIGLADLASFRACFGSVRGDAKYNAKCDFNNDGTVNINDLLKLRVGYKKCESWKAGCTQ